MEDLDAFKLTLNIPIKIPAQIWEIENEKDQLAKTNNFLTVKEIRKLKSQPQMRNFSLLNVSSTYQQNKRINVLIHH